MAIVKYFKILEINYTPLYGEEEELGRFPIHYDGIMVFVDAKFRRGC